MIYYIIIIPELRSNVNEFLEDFLSFFLRRDLLRPKAYWGQTETGQIWLGCCVAEGL